MKHIILFVFFAVVVQGAHGQSRVKTVDTAVASTTAFKMHFDDLFRHNADNSVSPVRMLLINGEIVNTDTKIENGRKYGGIMISLYYGHDALVDTQKSTVVIRKFLK